MRLQGRSDLHNIVRSNSYRGALRRARGKPQVAKALARELEGLQAEGVKWVQSDLTPGRVGQGAPPIVVITISKAINEIRKAGALKTNI